MTKTKTSTRDRKDEKHTPPPLATTPPKDEKKDERQSAAFVDRNNIGDGGGPKPKRLSFNVKPDGGIDWDGMKDGNRKELKDTLSADMTLREFLGMMSKEAEEFAITEDDVEEWLGWINGGNKFATAFALGKFKNFPIDPDILNAAYDLEHCPASHFPNQQMPHPTKCVNCEKKMRLLGEMKKRGTRLANRYCGEWIKKHIDLVMFMTLYFKSVGQQAQTAIAIQFMRNQEKEKHEKQQRVPAAKAAAGD